MSNASVAFLFGAGAEGKENYNIVTGNAFLKASLFGAGIDGYREALSDYFPGRCFKGGYKYSKDQLEPASQMIKNIVIEKIRHKPGCFTNLEKEVSETLNNDDIDELRREFEENSSSESYKLIEHIEHRKNNNKNKRESEFRDIIKEGRDYKSIEDNLLKRVFSENENGKCDIDANIALGGFIDSYFHTIINPAKYGPVRFSKVFNFYWACYFVVLRDILKLFPDIGNKYLKESESSIDYRKILEDHHVLTKEIYQTPLPKKRSYYEAIAEYLDDKDTKLAGVLTTNYFNLAESVLKGRTKNGCAYLNGQLKWMEKPESLEVFDLVEKKPETDLYFPFIFGQSLTKPIVHEKQITEFCKTRKILEEADCLIILGYGINEDDNHINSMLHEYLMKGKRVIIITNDRNAEYSEKLRVSAGKIEKKVYDYSKNKAKDIIYDVMKYADYR